MASWRRGTGIGQRPAGAEAGVIHQEVKVGRSRQRFCQEAHVGIDREVGGKDLDPHLVSLFEVLLQRLEPIAVSGHHQKIMPPGGELLAEHLADSGRGPGDHREGANVVHLLETAARCRLEGPCRRGAPEDIERSERNRRAASSRMSSVLQKTKRTSDRPPPPSRKKLEPGTGVTPISRESQTANSVS